MGTDLAKPPGSKRILLWGTGVYAVYVLLLLWVMPPGVVFGPSPYGQGDYQTHYYQIQTVSQALERFGRTWAYDPNLLAGFPTGLFFDVDNKGHTFFACALNRLGVPMPVAFNLFVLVSCLMAPLSLLWAARLLRFEPSAQLVALVFGVLLWYFDSGSRFAWYAGLISFATVSHLSPVVVALFYRLLTEGRTRFFVLLLLLLPLVCLLHALAVVVLVVPLAGLYLWRLRRLGLAAHLRVWALVAATLGANLFWLWPALRHIDWVVPSGRFLQSGLLSLLVDYLGVHLSPRFPIMSRTFVRIAAFCGAVLVIWTWRRERDDRFFVGILTVGYWTGMTFLAAYFPYLRETEPYRFIGTAFLMSGCLGAVFFARALSPATLRSARPPLRALLAVLAILAAPRLIIDLLFFLQGLSPAVPPLPRHFAGEVSIRLQPVRTDSVRVGRFLASRRAEGGRILVRDWALGEYLRWAEDLPVIGGFPDRRSIHQAANALRDAGDPRLRGGRFAEYLVRYNIRYVVISGEIFPLIELRRDLMQPVLTVKHHRVFRVRHGANDFLLGSGQVHATLNRIEVRQVRPAAGTQEVVLRYHYLETLTCRPRCTLQRAPIDGDPAGFIRIRGRPKLPARFVIENTY